MKQEKILVIGAAGQIGVELTLALREKFGGQNVIAADICAEPDLLEGGGPWLFLDALNKGELHSHVIRLQITQIYLLAAMLSATGERDPLRAWNLNMNSLLNVLEIAREEKSKIFWPSSIAVSSPTSTVYGNSKFAGECWCQYYFDKYGVDVRSLRYPGLISYKSKPGGGTTDYAIDIFHAALEKRTYECFLREGTALPMMYMPDAVLATLTLMESDGTRLTKRTSYDVGAISFTPQELYGKIKSFCTDFEIVYKPDHRQRIADSWSPLVDDSEAREDWGWSPAWNLTAMVNDMLMNLEEIKLSELSGKLENVGVL
jgi:nucleoside-diphosphate-sugar epimerase